jgi:hypothetical protein
MTISTIALRCQVTDTEIETSEQLQRPNYGQKVKATAAISNMCDWCIRQAVAYNYIGVGPVSIQ